MSDAVPRTCRISRTSRETSIALELSLDGGPVEVGTGVGFLDHLLGGLAAHSLWGLRLACRGDLWIDEHHSVEDCAIALGEALARALAAGGKPRRFGSAYAPLDEALARAVVDLSGRPYCRADLGLGGSRLGALAGENAEHFLSSLAMSARITLHVDLLAGENAHHKAEAAFKALALAFREACAVDTAAQAATGAGAATGGPEAAACAPGACAGPSTKGRVVVEELSGEDFAARFATLARGSET